MSQAFKSVGPEDPNELAHACRDVHWALQIPAGVGSALPSEPYAAQTNLTFSSGGVLQSRPLPKSGARGGLRLTDLHVLALDADGAEKASFALDGNTLDEGFGWLSEQLGALEGGDVPCARPEGIIPFHPVARGGLFLLTDREPLLQLVRWFESADSVLADMRAAHDGASALQVWPGGPYFSFGTGADDDDASAHVGFCPGDRTFAAPFFFVQAPKGSPPDRRYDGPGMWMHIPGQFTGAVLPGPDVVGAGDAAAQEKLVRTFLGAGLATVEG
jgi:hypothetical protein